MPQTSKPPKGTVAEQIGKSIDHPLRVDILTVLHEGPASQKELATQLREPLSNITHHINILRKEKAIEVAFTRKVGNVDQHYWRALTTSTYSPEDLAQLTEEEHEALLRIVAQSKVAELLSAFREGNLTGDLLASLGWDRVWLDDEGYEELSEVCAMFFDQMYGIAAKAAARSSETGNEMKAYIGGVMAFRRGRPMANVTATVDELGLGD